MVNLALSGPMLRSFYVFVVAILLLFAPRRADAAPSPALSAVTPAASASATAVVEVKVDSDSPRVSMAEFLAACNRGDFTHAADFLELLPSETARGPALARMLKAVLDRYLNVDVELLSRESLGNRNDLLPGNTDELGKIANDSGKFDPVRIVRRQRGNVDVWVFSHATVQHIDAWYETLPHRWTLDHLPEPLLRPGPRGVLRWQWIALPLLALFALLAGAVISRGAVYVLHAVAKKTPASWDDAIVARLGGPLTLSVGVGLCYIALPTLGLYASAETFVVGLLRTLIFVAFFWSILRSVDVIADILRDSPWGQSHVASRSFLSLGSRIAKVTLGVMATVAVVSELGYPVASLIAGLGIGGLALALASQKTVENLFGAFSIGVDQPFREGDYIKVEDFSGTVESIGLRSTRVRTLDRTVITIPNGKLAEMRIETFAPRDRFRFACTLGLVHATTASQMRVVVAGFEEILRGHPKVWPNGITVRFKELTSSSLDIDIAAWFVATDPEFQLIRQDVLLQFMEVVEKAGTSFAHPTRTLHIASKPS
jgi:MscS family membrane protein